MFGLYRYFLQIINCVYILSLLLFLVNKDLMKNCFKTLITLVCASHVLSILLSIIFTSQLFIERCGIIVSTEIGRILTAIICSSTIFISIIIHGIGSDEYNKLMTEDDSMESIVNIITFLIGSILKNRIIPFLTVIAIADSIARRLL